MVDNGSNEIIKNCECESFIQKCQKKFTFWDFVIFVIFLVFLIMAICVEISDVNKLYSYPQAPPDSSCELYGCYAKNRVTWRIVFIGALIASLVILYIMHMLNITISSFLFILIVVTIFLVNYGLASLISFHSHGIVCDKSKPSDE